MPKKSKRLKEALTKIDRSKIYPLAEAVSLIKETSQLKFDATVEVHVRLGIDPKKSDQSVRSSVSLPFGTGKTVTIAAFVTPHKEKEAKEAGADIVGGKDLIEKIKKDGKIDFEVAIAEPDIMRELAVIAKTLGQKGLMPSPKVGTVTTDIKKAVEELKKGKINFKNDDTGNIHVIVGKVSFPDEQLRENIQTFMEALKKMKPESLKGTYILSVTLSSTMGPGIKVKV